MTVFEDGTGPIVVSRMADRAAPGRHRRQAEPGIAADVLTGLVIYVVLIALLVLALS